MFAWSRRLDWAVRMKGTWGFEGLRCPRCRRRRRVLSTITRRSPRRRWLIRSSSISAREPRRGLARPRAIHPDWEQVGFEGFDAA
jgi:hypothetical protein